MEIKRTLAVNGKNVEGRKEMFYLTTHSTYLIYGYMEGRKEMFYLTTHSTHFIYGYMVSDIW